MNLILLIIYILFLFGFMGYVFIIIRLIKKDVLNLIGEANKGDSNEILTKEENRILSFSTIFIICSFLIFLFLK